MANYYAKHLGPKFKDLLAELALDSDEERMSLRDEVDAIMLTAREAACIYEQVCVEGKLDKKDDAGVVHVNHEARAAAKKAFENALASVKDFKETWAKTEVLRKDKISVNNLNWWISSVLKLVNDIYGFDIEKVKQFEDGIHAIRMLDDGKKPKVTIVVE
jgi:hypothetical protein